MLTSTELFILSIIYAIILAIIVGYEQISILAAITYLVVIMLIVVVGNIIIKIIRDITSKHWPR